MIFLVQLDGGPRFSVKATFPVVTEDGPVDTADCIRTGGDGSLLCVGVGCRLIAGEGSRACTSFVKVSLTISGDGCLVDGEGIGSAGGCWPFLFDKTNGGFPVASLAGSGSVQPGAIVFPGPILPLTCVPVPGFARVAINGTSSLSPAPFLLGALFMI